VIGDGKLDIINEAEIPAIIYNTFSKLGITKFRIKVNNRKILNGFYAMNGMSERAGDKPGGLKTETTGRAGSENDESALCCRLKWLCLLDFIRGIWYSTCVTFWRCGRFSRHVAKQ